MPPRERQVETNGKEKCKFIADLPIAKGLSLHSEGTISWNTKEITPTKKLIIEEIQKSWAEECSKNNKKYFPNQVRVKLS